MLLSGIKVSVSGYSMFYPDVEISDKDLDKIADELGDRLADKIAEKVIEKMNK